MPSLDLALRLRPYGDASIAYRVTGETVRRGHASFSDPPTIPPNHPRYSTIHCPLSRRGLWRTTAWSQPDAVKASWIVAVTSSARMFVQSFHAMM
jgi:hypothetical protein